MSADFCGSLFKWILTKLPGATEEARCSNLFLAIQKYYSEVACESCLDNLKLTMLGSSNTSPKLRAKAAEVRCLIPFSWRAAQEQLSDGIVLEATAKQASYHLLQCYESLSEAVYDPARLKEHSRKFALLVVALREVSGDDQAWSTKPKLHMMQELCEESKHRVPVLR